MKAEGWALVVAVVVALVGGVWFFVFRATPELAVGELNFGLSANVLEGVGVSQESVQQESQAVAQAFSRGAQAYTSSAYGFSFTYPKEYTVGTFAEGEGEVVLLQDPSNQKGLQVTITPFDEPLTTLTEARIRQDLPSLDMRATKQVSMPGGIPALFFVSSGGDFGESVELWFIHAGNLYQLSTYASQVALLEQVGSTWQFK